MKNKEFKIGVLTLVAGVVLYFGFNFLKGEDFLSSTNKYVTYYENVDGLTVSNPVIVSGYTVGRVKSINLVQDENGRRLKVVLDVVDEIPVGDSTIAVLISSDLLGGKAIDLKLGNSNKLFKSEDVIASTTEKSITEELELRAKPVLNSLDTALQRFSSLMNPEDQKNIHASIKNIRETTEIIKQMAAENRKTYNDIGSTVKATIESSSKSITEIDKKLKSMLDKLNVFADTLNTLHLANTLRDVESAIADLQSIMNKLNSTEGTVGLMLNDKKVYENLNESLKSLDKLLKHVDESPDHYMSPLGKTKKQIEKERRKEEKKKQ